MRKGEEGRLMQVDVETTFISQLQTGQRCSHRCRAGEIEFERSVMNCRKKKNNLALMNIWVIRNPWPHIPLVRRGQDEGAVKEEETFAIYLMPYPDRQLTSVLSCVCVYLLLILPDKRKEQIFFFLFFFTSAVSWVGLLGRLFSECFILLSARLVSDPT